MASRAVQVKVMKYEFDYKVEAADFWQLSMYGIYHSLAGVCNIIFTVAMILLTAKFWENTGSLTRIFLLTASSLFIIIQPIVIYRRAKKQAAGSRPMKIGFDEQGIHVKAENQNSDVKWKKLRGISKMPGMMVIHLEDRHGFILTDRMLGEQKEDFYQYAACQIPKARSN